MKNSYDNIMTYLKWRGDVSIKEHKFNEVDALILTELVYLNFENIVPGIDVAESVSIQDVAKKYVKVWEGTFFERHENLLDELARSPRFANMTLSNYECRFDAEKQQQFAAVHIQVSKNYTFIAFRGTDSSIVGWKEDFNMSYMMPVPAQQSAVEYVNRTIKGLFTKFYFGGHSKGGNLAIYAGTFCEPKIQKKIIEIYSFDGPGFPETVVCEASYKNIEKRVLSFVPEMSIVGMLMEHAEELTVVASGAMAIMQHDAFTWMIERDHLLKAEKLHDLSVSVDHNVKSWLAEMSAVEREELVEAFFSVFESVGIKDFMELKDMDIKTTAALIKAAAKVSVKQRTMVLKLLKLMVENPGGAVKE